ncbi:MAG: hypothetical protein ABIH17_06355 [Pseudomonadota bacterium]
MSIDVSCLCLTHGRHWLLAEAVESFRRQRIGSLTSELLIVNDCPEQELVCDMPGVVVVNTGEWIPDLSRKTNFAMVWARGRHACLWDDDDISLPGRIADGVSRMAGTLCYRPTACWSWGCGHITHMGQPLLCAAMFDRMAAIESGGCIEGEWNDKSLWDRFWPSGNVVQYQPKPEESQYIYRWAGIGWHESGGGEPDARVRAAQFRKAALGDPRFTPGRVEIKPEWKSNYRADVAMAIRTGKGDVLK